MSAIALIKPISETAANVARCGAHIVRGREAILRLQGALSEFSTRCDQAGAMNDLPYFLSRPGVTKKIPSLILISTGSMTPKDDASPDGLMGMVLLYEHRVARRGIGIFATDDTTGRRTVVAPLAVRAAVAMRSSQMLVDRGAQTVLISFRHEADGIDASVAEILRGSNMAYRWASREREIVGYLPLEGTLDATLAKLGQRTRNHLRYYRKRAEAQLGSSFVPEADISREEFLTLNRECAYAVPDDVSRWRYDSLASFATPLLFGVRDNEGRWLSLIGGRRDHAKMEVHWQLNRQDMPAYSLSTVMRSYLMEYEIAQGTTRLYFEGGTTHSMNHSFVMEKATDLIAVRRSPVAGVIPQLAKRFLPPENMLGQIFLDKELCWHSAGKS